MAIDWKLYKNNFTNYFNEFALKVIAPIFKIFAIINAVKLVFSLFAVFSAPALIPFYASKMFLELTCARFIEKFNEKKENASMWDVCKKSLSDAFGTSKTITFAVAAIIMAMYILPSVLYAAAGICIFSVATAAMGRDMLKDIIGFGVGEVFFPVLKEFGRQSNDLDSRIVDITDKADVTDIQAETPNSSVNPVSTNLAGSEFGIAADAKAL